MRKKNGLVRLGTSTTIEFDLPLFTLLANQLNAELVGRRNDAVREQIFAITTERRLTHPITAALCQFAQDDIFGNGAPRRKKK